MRRAEKGRYAIDHNSVIVVDEVALVGVKQMHSLMKLQQRTGAQEPHVLVCGQDDQRLIDVHERGGGVPSQQ